MGAAIAGSFRDAIREGRDLVSTLRDIALRLSDIALSAAFKPVERFLGSLFDSLFAGLIGGLRFSADGNVFDRGEIVPFAAGGWPWERIARQVFSALSGCKPARSFLK